MPLEFTRDLLYLMQKYDVSVGEVLQSLTYLDVKGCFNHGKVVSDLSTRLYPGAGKPEE